MVYTVLPKKKDRQIRSDPQSSVGRGDRVWRTLKEARTWRDRNEPRMGVFGVLAGWGVDTVPSDTGAYHTLSDTFKIIQIEEILPRWIKDATKRVVQDAWEEGRLDGGYINPDHVTPEQEEVYYEKHRDEVMFMLRCLISLSVFEELEVLGLLEPQEERGHGERPDTSEDDTSIFRYPGS